MVEISNSEAEVISSLMKDVMTTRVKERAARFAAFHQGFSPFLAALRDNSIVMDGNAGRMDKEKFLRHAEIYLRALSSYSIASNAWLDVFAAFKRIFDIYVYGKPRHDLTRTVVLDPMRPNPELTTHWRMK